MTKKILVIDDEVEFAKGVIKPHLESSGKYEVHAESSGLRALDAVQNVKPDVVLIDIMIRDLAGPKIAQNIKSQKEFKEIPIIYLTATRSRNEGEESLVYDGKIGDIPYLAKPIQLDRLSTCLEMLVGS